jgi:hypothetical protein
LQWPKNPFRGITDVQVGVGVVRKLKLQTGREVTVDLQHVEFCAGRQQGSRQRPASRADFHDLLTVKRVDGLDDAFDDARVTQEVLAEPLSGLVTHGSGQATINDRAALLRF